MTKLKFIENWKNWGFPYGLVALGLALTALLPLLLPGSKAQTGPLLAPTNSQVSTNAKQNPTVIRSQNVVVNIQQLKDPQLSRLTVPLFNGATVVLTRNRVETTREGGFLWHGKIADQPGSSVILSVVGEVLIGNIATQNGERYQIGIWRWLLAAPDRSIEVSRRSAAASSTHHHFYTRRHRTRHLRHRPAV